MISKKKWIILGIIVSILIVIVIVVLIVRKNDDKDSKPVYPISGLKIGMEYEKAMKLLEKKKIDVEKWETAGDEISLWNNIYLDFFETETYFFIDIYTPKNEVSDMYFSPRYESEEECEKVINKIIRDFNKRYGKASIREGEDDSGNYREYTWIIIESDVVCCLKSRDSECEFEMRWDGSYYWYLGAETIHLFYDACSKALYLNT